MRRGGRGVKDKESDRPGDFPCCSAQAEGLSGAVQGRTESTCQEAVTS